MTQELTNLETVALLRYLEKQFIPYEDETIWLIIRKLRKGLETDAQREDKLSSTESD